MKTEDPYAFDQKASYNPLKQLSLLVMRYTDTRQANAGGQQTTKKTTKSEAPNLLSCDQERFQLHQKPTGSNAKSTPKCPAKNPVPRGNVSFNLKQQKTRKCLFHCCPKCGNGYNKKEELERHMKEMHPVEKTNRTEWQLQKMDSLVSHQKASNHSLKQLSLSVRNCTETPQVSAGGQQIKSECEEAQNSCDQERFQLHQKPTESNAKSTPKCPAKNPVPRGNVPFNLEQQETRECLFYCCPKCGKGYNKKEELERHMKEMHPVEKTNRTEWQLQKMDYLVSDQKASSHPLKLLSLLVRNCTETPQVSAGGQQITSECEEAQNSRDQERFQLHQKPTGSNAKSTPKCPAKKPYQTRSVSSNLEQQKRTECLFYCCPKCGKGYNKKEELERHMKEMHPVQKLQKMDSLVSHQKASNHSLKQLSLLVRNCTETPQVSAGGQQITSECEEAQNSRGGENVCPDQVATKTIKKFKSNCPAEKPDMVQLQKKQFFFYRCPKCGNGYNEKEEYKQHMKEKHPVEKTHHCTECGKSFAAASELSYHQRVHTGEKPFYCQECGKCFASKPKLRLHQRIHTGEKPYYCTECGKSFAAVASLSIHKRIHTGEKPYKCSYCEKSFRQRNSRKGHERTHTGEKPYSCKECGKGFYTMAGYKIHEKIHLGVKPHICRECGKCFSTLWNVEKHMRVHTGEKPFICKVCGKCFASYSNCLYHQKNHTKVRVAESE